MNGKDTHPLYRYLKREARGVLGSEPIKWNFTKFLIGREGEVVERYGSTTKPEQIEGNVAAGEWRLTVEEMAGVDEIAK